ncbi:tetratricopeptide (TPR) repeat protein [Arthrobacter sp. UYCu723]
MGMNDWEPQRSLVGRSRELASLETFLSAALAGRRMTALVDGPSGIGKSALISGFLSRHPELLVLRASGVHWESGEAYGVLQQLRSSAGQGTPLAPDGPSEPWQDPLTAGIDFMQLLGEVQQTAPLVIIVDDVHWADIESLQAVSSALRRMTTGRVLLILLGNTNHPGELPAGVPEFMADFGGEVMTLGPLTAPDIQRMAATAGPVLSLPAARQLLEHTQGNPLYIRQLLQECPASMWLQWQAGLPAPRAFAATVLQNLASCSPSTRAFTEAVATLGLTARLADAAALADLDEPLGAFEEACTAGLLARSQSGGLYTLSFPHPLVRAAIYESLGPLRRALLHRRAADIMDDEGQRLLHRVAATPLPDQGLAGDLDAFAARQAASGAWSAVADALIKASRLSLSKEDRQSRLLLAVDALIGAGDLDSASALIPEVESFDPSPLRDAVLGYLAILRGRPNEAEQLLTSAWQLRSPTDPPEVSARIAQRRVLHSLAQWRGPAMVRWAEQATELAKPGDPSRTESQAIVGLGLGAAGETQEALDTYDRYCSQDNPGAQSQRVRMGRGWLLLALDRPESARVELESAVPTEYQMGSARISLFARSWLARTEFVLGNWDAALHMSTRAASLAESSGIELLRPLAPWTATEIYALRGDWEAASEHLRRASATSGNYEMMFIPACLARAQFAQVQGDYEAVVRALQPLELLQPRQGIDEPGFWQWHDVYANALVMTDRMQDAHEFLVPHEKLALLRGHRSTIARLAYVRGRIFGAEGDIEAAKMSFEHGLAQLDGLPMPYCRARVKFAYGQTLRRAGKRREASAQMQDAKDAFTVLGRR